MIIPGMVSATFRGLPAEEILDLCVKGELKGVEWSENAHVMPGDEKGADLLRQKTEKAGLEVAAYGSYYRLGQQEDPEAVFLPSVKAAAALGAPIIRIWGGTEPSALVNEEKRLALAKEAGIVCEIGSHYGIKVALEWHKNTLTDTNESAMDFLKETDSDNLYCLWQPTVALSQEERKHGLDLLGGRLLNLHIYYWKEGIRRPLKEGVQEWLGYLEHVDLNQPRFGLLEFVMNNTKAQFLEDAAVLHQILETASKIRRKNTLENERG